MRPSVDCGAYGVRCTKPLGGLKFYVAQSGSIHPETEHYKVGIAFRGSAGYPSSATCAHRNGFGCRSRIVSVERCCRWAVAETSLTLPATHTPGT